MILPLCVSTLCLQLPNFIILRLHEAQGQPRAATSTCTNAALHSRRLTRKRFAWLACLLSPPSPQALDDPTLAAMVMEEADLDGDGIIVYQEFIIAMCGDETM